MRLFFLPKLIIFPEQSADEARTHQTTSYHKMPELLRIKKTLTGDYGHLLYTVYGIT